MYWNMGYPWFNSDVIHDMNRDNDAKQLRFGSFWDRHLVAYDPWESQLAQS